MADELAVPKTFGASSRKISPEQRKILEEIDRHIDEVILKELEPAIVRARAALGLNEQ